MEHFFSYSRKDSEFVIKLAGELEAQNCDVWLDLVDLQPGAKWDRSIEEALGRAQSLIVILSAASVQSENVMDEVSYALEKGKLVIPIVIEPCEVPLRLRRLQYIDFTAAPYKTSLQALVTRIKSNEATLENTPPQTGVAGAQTPQHNTAQKKPHQYPIGGQANKGTFFHRYKITVIVVASILLLFVIIDFMLSDDTATNTTSTEHSPQPTLIAQCGEQTISYQRSGENIVFYFVLENGCIPTIFVDVNADKKTDKLDRIYTTEDDKLYSGLIFSNDYDELSSAVANRKDDTLMLSVPVNELMAPGSTKDAARVQFKLKDAKGSQICQLPAGVAEDDFEKTYAINLTATP